MEGGGEVTAPGYEEIITRSAPMLHSAPAQTLITIIDIAYSGPASTILPG